jgi:hypothetical protein
LGTFWLVGIVGRTSLLLFHGSMGGFNVGGMRRSHAAESLLSQSIASWQRQPQDEQAGSYRVCGAIKDMDLLEREGRAFLSLSLYRPWPVPKTPFKITPRPLPF